MTRLSAPWLASPAVQQVCGLLETAGHQALFVGGCVRNTLLGEPVSDHDLSTDARPDVVMALMSAAGLKAIPTGVEHGTVTIVAGGEPFEITTFRNDIETDGRRAVVHFSDCVIEDARRRDFTMNAIYCDARGEIVDPLDGLPDLMARRLRFVGDPVARVREDYLRILRFFRFLAWYADPEQGIDPHALDTCAANADGLDRISAERIGAEMRKLLSAPDPAPSVAVMKTSGVLDVILPGADVTALPVVVHLEAEARLAPDWVLRLAALNQPEAAARLRLSRHDARRLEKIAQVADPAIGPGERGYRLGARDGLAAEILLGARLGVVPAPAALAQVRAGAEAVFPLTAQDLMPGLRGPDLGAAMKTLERRWIASGFTLSREALLG